jgi:hypothetical protein
MDTKSQLLLEHQDVDAHLEAMKAAVVRDDPRALSVAWTRFERDLGDHMRFEETELLWRFAGFDPEEAAALRAEHDRIRKLVAELGISADLHTLRVGVADQLLEELRAHARREEKTLYRWAAERLPPNALEPVRDERLGHEVRQGIDELRVKLHLLGMDARDELAQIQRDADGLRKEAARLTREGYRQLLERLRRLAAPLD